MFKLILMMLSVIVFLMQSVNAEENVAVYPVYKIRNDIAVSFEINNDEWNKFPVATDFFVYGMPETLCPKQTSFRIAWSADALYMDVVCSEPDAALIKCSQQDGGALWGENSIEIFVKVGERVEQFIINAAGKRYWHENGGRENKIMTSCQILKDSWRMKVKIPFEVLGKTPEIGEKWHFNIVRDNLTRVSKMERISSWAAVISSLRSELDSSPFICFYPDSLTDEKAKSLSVDVRREHLKNILFKISKDEKQCKFYFNEVRKKISSEKISSTESVLSTCEIFLNSKKYENMAKVTEIAQSISSLKDELLRIALENLVNESQVKE